MVAKRVVLSGIQPTGTPHIGNYLGALSNWVLMQQDTTCQAYYSIVDLHAITVPQDPCRLRANVHRMAVSLLAVGMDPEKSVLFRQSKVPMHSELAWILFCRTPVSWLGRMHQWKAKSHGVSLEETLNEQRTGGLNEPISSSPSLGLLAYPVLQAADILLYGATEVPVGEDQFQHMNLTVDIAKSFNSHYKTKVFTVPRGIYASNQSKKIMSLRIPTSKMSKSDPSEHSRIDITDSPDTILSKIRKATMDSMRGVTFDPVERPGVANLLRVYASFVKLRDPGSVEATPEGCAVVFAEYDNKKLKEVVGECIVEGLRPVRERYLQFEADAGYVEDVLRKGEAKAAIQAGKTLEEVRKAVGLEG